MHRLWSFPGSRLGWIRFISVLLQGRYHGSRFVVWMLCFYLVIHRSLQNPNVVMWDDLEVISYLISKAEPLFWKHLSHKVQDCVGEVFLRWIVPIMGDVAVHDGRVIQWWSADLQDFALARQADIYPFTNYLFKLFGAHRLSPCAKKSFSTANLPILVCRSLTSDSIGSCGLAPPENTPDRPSTACSSMY